MSNISLLDKKFKNSLSMLSKEKASKIVHIYPYDKRARIVSSQLIKKIKETLPSAKVLYMGSAALGISGVKDIDLFVFCTPKKKQVYIKKLKLLFGHTMVNDHKFCFSVNGFNCSVVVSNPSDQKRKEQIQIFNSLKKDKILLRKYELLKVSMNGKTYRKYLITKMNFFFRLICINFKENLKNTSFLLRAGAAVKNSHIITPTGDHATASFTRFKLYRDSVATSYVAKSIAEKFRNDRVEIVVNLSHGGDIINQGVSLYLSKMNHRKVLSLTVEKQKSKQLVLIDKSNKLLIKNKRVLIVDDTINGGDSVKKLDSFVRSLGANVVGLGVICSRNVITPESLGVQKFYSFILQDDFLASFKPKECPMCKQKIPINKNFGMGV